MRDIAVSRSRDNGATFGQPIRVSEDGWKIDACPDDGPAMARMAIAASTSLADAHAGDTPHKGIFYSALTGEGSLRACGSMPAMPIQRTRRWPLTSTPTLRSSGTSGSANEARRVQADRRRQGGAAATFNGDGVGYPAVASTEGAWIVLWTSQDAAGRSVIEGRRIPAGEGH